MSSVPGMRASSGVCAAGARGSRPSEAQEGHRPPSLSRLGFGLSEETDDRLLGLFVLHGREEAGPQLIECIVAHSADPLSLIEGIQVIDGAAHGAGPNAVMNLDEKGEGRFGVL